MAIQNLNLGTENQGNGDSLRAAMVKIQANTSELYNKALAPLYNLITDLPVASDHHGMFAHVHETGAAYFAHAGNWVKLQNEGYFTAGANVQISPTGEISSTDTQLTDSEISALGYIKTETDSQQLTFIGGQLSISNGNTITIPDTNTQLTDSEISALGYIKTYTDTNTQLSDSEIGAFGYIKTDTNTQLSETEVVSSLNDRDVNLGTGNLTANSFSITGTEAVQLPTGTTAQRPSSGVAGQFRYNTTENEFEGYTTEWGAIAGSGGGSSSIASDQFTANGSDVNFTLVNGSPTEKSLTMVFIQGVYQAKANYNLVSNQIQFTAVPSEDDTIEVLSISAALTGNAVTSVNGQTGIVLVDTNPGVLVVNNNTTAVANKVYVFTASLTLTLPSSPASGDTIKISNRSLVDTCILARNGSNILGAAEDLTLDNAGASFELIYTDTSNGWVIIGQ